MSLNRANPRQPHNGTSMHSRNGKGKNGTSRPVQLPRFLQNQEGASRSNNDSGALRVGTAMDDLKDELMKAKKISALAQSENSFLHSKLRIVEQEYRKQEQELSTFLENGLNSSKHLPRDEQLLRVNSLKRKVLEYRRALREKSEQNMNLLADQNVAKAARTRERLAALEVECDQLREHLARSIPEVEFIREKQQFLEIINRLTEENMELRERFGEFKKHYDGTQQTMEQLQYEETLLAEHKKSALLAKEQASEYRRALVRLTEGNRRSKSYNTPEAKRGKGTPMALDRSANGQVESRTRHKVTPSTVASTPAENGHIARITDKMVTRGEIKISAMSRGAGLGMYRSTSVGAKTYGERVAVHRRGSGVSTALSQRSDDDRKGMSESGESYDDNSTSWYGKNDEGVNGKQESTKKVKRRDGEHPTSLEASIKPAPSATSETSRMRLEEGQSPRLIHQVMRAVECQLLREKMIRVRQHTADSTAKLV